MQNTPNIDVVVEFDIKDKVGAALQRPETEIWQVQFMSVTRRATRGVAADLAIGLLQGIDEAERRRFGALIEIMLDRLKRIQVGPFAWDDGLGFQRRGRCWTWLRKLSK